MARAAHLGLLYLALAKHGLGQATEARQLYKTTIDWLNAELGADEILSRTGSALTSVLDGASKKLIPASVCALRQT